MAVKVTVPSSLAGKLRLSYNDNVHEPVEYTVSKDGAVQVEEQHVPAFLAAVDGSRPASGPAEEAARQVTPNPQAGPVVG
jgi:hypothetical protein